MEKSLESGGEECLKKLFSVFKLLIAAPSTLTVTLENYLGESEGMRRGKTRKNVNLFRGPICSRIVWYWGRIFMIIRNISCENKRFIVRKSFTQLVSFSLSKIFSFSRFFLSQVDSSFHCLIRKTFSFQFRYRCQFFSLSFVSFPNQNLIILVTCIFAYKNLRFYDFDTLFVDANTLKSNFTLFLLVSNRDFRIFELFFFILVMPCTLSEVERIRLAFERLISHQDLLKVCFVNIFGLFSYHTIPCKLSQWLKL